jgi:hypothetical protein
MISQLGPAKIVEHRTKVADRNRNTYKEEPATKIDFWQNEPNVSDFARIARRPSSWFQILQEPHSSGWRIEAVADLQS